MKNVDTQPETGKVIQNITITPIRRTTQDIEKWRNALQEAEAVIQYRSPLYDLYTDILLDAALSTTVEKRILNVTKHDLFFVDNNGIENTEITLLASLHQFRELRKEILQTKFWGISVIELIKDEKGFRIFNVDRKHIQPKQGKITNEQNSFEGIYYKQEPYNKFVLEVGRYDDLGLLLKAAPYVIYKRGGFGNWSNFTQLFGMPFREARYSGYNNATVYQLEQALVSMGSAGFGIFPEGSTITFHEASNADANGELYNLLRNACNEEITMCILGQTNTTLPNPGKLGNTESPHVATQNDIEKNDCVEELSVLNDKVLPILLNLGYPVKDGEFRHKANVAKIGAVQMSTMLSDLKNNMGLPISNNFLYETFGVRKPKNYS